MSKVLITPVLTYASETWTMVSFDLKKMNDDMDVSST
jgi:hypothetical protein